MMHATGPESGQAFTRDLVNIKRFWSRVQIAEGCWLWGGAVGPGGYGTFCVKKFREGPVHAHRVSYVVQHGSIPAGMCVMHLCDTPRCVNPSHLKLGTQAENMADSIAKRRSRWFKARTCKCGRVIQPTRRCVACLAASKERRRLAMLEKDRGASALVSGSYYAEHIAPLVPASFSELVALRDVRRATIFARYFALFGFAPATCQSMADEQGVSRERIRQLRNDVLRKVGLSEEVIRKIPKNSGWKASTALVA